MGWSDEKTCQGYGEKGGHGDAQAIQLLSLEGGQGSGPRGAEETGGGACCWSLVQLDHDGEMGPVHGFFCTLDAECEVRRIVNRTEPWLLSSVFLQE